LGLASEDILCASRELIAALEAKVIVTSHCITLGVMHWYIESKLLGVFSICCAFPLCELSSAQSRL